MVSVGDCRQLCKAGFKIDRHFRACSSGSGGGSRNRGQGFAHALNFSAHVLDGLARSFDFFAELLHLFASVKHDLLNNAAELLLFFFKAFQLFAGVFEFKLKLHICALVDFASRILLCNLVLHRFQTHQLIPRILDRIAQRRLLFFQQIGVCGVEFQRLVHIFQRGVEFLCLGVDGLQRFVKPLGFAVKFDGNAFDAL